MKLESLGANQTEVEIKNTLVLFSYKTPVAVRHGDGTFSKTSKKWSVTTSRHINSWLRSFGLDPEKVLTVSQEYLDALTA